MNVSVALPTFVITLREGVEAALVVGIVLACLKRSRQNHLRIWVYAGVALGIAVSAQVGVLLSWLVQNLGGSQRYGGVMEPLLEGVFSVIAIAMLSWMLIWMTQQARSLKSNVEGAVTSALKSGSRAAGWGVFTLIFIAVLREGFESVLFIVAKFQQGIVPALGALTGLAAAAGIGVLLFKFGIRLNLRLFFQIMGVLLLLVVAGLVVTALGHFDTVISTLASADRQSESLCFFYEHFARTHSCVLGPLVWNLAKVLPDDRFPGLLFSALFGYTQQLYLVQAVGYLVFLLLIGGLYFQSLSGRSMTSARKPMAE